MNKIIYRNFTLQGKDLISGNCVLNHAATGESLVADTLDFKMWTDTGKARLDGEFLTSDGKTLITQNALTFRCLIEEELTDFTPGDPVYYYYNNVLINKFYLQDVKRAGKYIYDFSCVSAIAILENSVHYGGIYNGAALSTILTQIFEGIPYSIDPIVGQIKIYGWLPYASKRNNLQQITIATGLAIKTKTDGTLHITALSSDNKGSFGENRVVIGGDVEVGTPCTAVQVTEHSYQTSTEEIVLFNESFFTQEVILFPEPVHSLSITGGAIVSSSANHAIVQGAGLVNLKGKKYLHNTKKITVGTITNTSKDNIINVAGATLITSLNSKAVADKLFEVFSKPKAIKNKVLHGNEKAGDVVSVINPYTLLNESAFLKRMDINMSNLLVSDAEFLANYAPSGVITGYKNRVVLTSGTSWSVPAGVTEIRAVLIGGGAGGQAGFNGGNGMRGYETPSLSDLDESENSPWMLSYNGEAGDGGNGGSAGAGGKIVDTGPLNVTPGASLPVSIGANGQGGAANGAAGTAGGETTFGAYTTANGQPSPTGYVDIMTSALYAINGFPGFKGQKGIGKDNLPSPYMTSIITQTYEGTGYNTSYIGTGYLGSPRWQGYYYGSPKKYSFSAAGGGGGSSRNTRGNSGTGAEYSYNNGKLFLDGGDGGNGADGGPSINANIYGGGGYGGHGGGGGGGGGGASNHLSGENYYMEGSGGTGGAGGPGGNGKSGCVIIYY